MVYKPARPFCLWNFPGKNTGVGCHFLLQRIFLTQGLNPNLSWLGDSLPLNHLGSSACLVINCLTNQAGFSCVFFIFFTKPCLSSRPQHWAFRNLASAVSSSSWLGLVGTLKTLQLELNALLMLGSWKPCLQSLQTLVFWAFKSDGGVCSPLVPALNHCYLAVSFSPSAIPRSPMPQLYPISIPSPWPWGRRIWIVPLAPLE